MCVLVFLSHFSPLLPQREHGASKYLQHLHLVGRWTASRCYKVLVKYFKHLPETCRWFILRTQNRAEAADTGQFHCTQAKRSVAGGKSAEYKHLINWPKSPSSLYVINISFSCSIHFSAQMHTHIVCFSCSVLDCWCEWKSKNSGSVLQNRKKNYCIFING